jgi:hypothetical protein
MLVYLLGGLLISQSPATSPASSRSLPQTTVVLTINAPVERVFNYVVPVDLAHIFRATKGIPAVKSTSSVPGWDRVGLSRTVYFETGDTAREQLTHYQRPVTFAYRVSHFSSVLKRIALHADGNWVFTELPNHQTRVEWTYRVTPHNGLARMILRRFLKRRFRPYMQSALTIIKNDLES